MPRPVQRARRGRTRSRPDHPRHGRRRLHRLRAGERLLDRGYKRARPRPPVLGRGAAGALPRPRRARRRRRARHARRRALDGVDGVIHLAGLSNDPTAEYDPEANWQMNAVATETLGRACVERGIERSCSPPPARSTTGSRRACTTRTRDDPAARRLRDLEALRRGGAARAGRRRPLPGDPAQRHRLRLQPAHALRPRGQHVRQGRAAAGPAHRCTAAAGCGARWSTSATSPTR